MTTKLNRSIIATIGYSSHFNFPLTLDEIWLRLINYKTTKKDLIKNITELVRNKVVTKSGNYYYLPTKKDLVTNRQKNFNQSKTLLNQAQHAAHLLARFDSVLAIFVTGSLAVSNAQSSDDIDLMIITKPHMLWTTRLILTIYTTLLGLRRTPFSTNFAGKLCLNLYLTTDSLSIPKTRRSLYTAYELIQIKPIYDPAGIIANLLQANTWIIHYIPNYIIPKPSHIINSSPAKKTSSIIEFLSFKLQYIYMHHKITREYITPDSAFFHPKDPGRIILRKIKP